LVGFKEQSERFLVRLDVVFIQIEWPTPVLINFDTESPGRGPDPGGTV
jgi:hypothetical protein